MREMTEEQALMLLRIEERSGKPYVAFYCRCLYCQFQTVCLMPLEVPEMVISADRQRVKIKCSACDRIVWHRLVEEMNSHLRYDGEGL